MECFEQTINSTVSEKQEIKKLIEKLKIDLVDLYDGYASPNEDLFNMVDIDLVKLRNKVTNFKVGRY